MPIVATTGPRTDAGKAASAQNAVQHGLRSAGPLGPGEDPAVYEAFALELIVELKPVGMQQRLLAERIAQLHWKLQRIAGVESFTLYHGEVRLQDMADSQHLRPPMDLSTAQLISIDLDAMLKLQNYEVRLQRAVAQTTRELRQLLAEATASRKLEGGCPQPSPTRPTAEDNRPPAVPAAVANDRPDKGLPQNWVRSAESHRAPAAAAPEPPPTPAEAGKETVA